MGGQIPCQRKALRQMKEATLFWGASNLMRGGGWGGGEEYSLCPGGGEGCLWSDEKAQSLSVK